MVAFGELGTEPFKAAGGVGKPAGTNASKGTGTAAATISAPSPVLSWLSSPNAWRVLKAAGVACPGRVVLDKIEGWERTEKWDAKGGKSTSGATLTHTESPLAEGSFTIELWMEEHAAQWASWLAVFRFDASKKTGSAVTIYHPALASLQPPVTAVVMTGHTPVLPDSRGRALVTIKLKEQRQAVAVGSGTAKGATQYYQVGKDGKPKNTPGEDPAVTKLKQQAAALAAQAAALA